jgi:hypothetical protein
VSTSSQRVDTLKVLYSIARLPPLTASPTLISVWLAPDWLTDRFVTDHSLAGEIRYISLTRVAHQFTKSFCPWQLYLVRASSSSYSSCPWMSSLSMIWIFKKRITPTPVHCVSTYRATVEYHTETNWLTAVHDNSTRSPSNSSESWMDGWWSMTTTLVCGWGSWTSCFLLLHSPSFPCHRGRHHFDFKKMLCLVSTTRRVSSKLLSTTTVSKKMLCLVSTTL